MSHSLGKRAKYIDLLLTMFSKADFLRVIKIRGKWLKYFAIFNPFKTTNFGLVHFQRVSRLQFLYLMKMDT